MTPDRHVLRCLVLLVTEDCNLRCEYCYIHKRPRSMDQKTARQAVDFLFAANSTPPERPEIGFFGGEPTLVPEIIDTVCCYAKERGRSAGVEPSFSMTTNATHLNDFARQVITDHAIHITCSLDGVGAPHDRFRKTPTGGGSFRLVEKKLSFLASLPNTTIRMTIMPETCAEVCEGILWLIEKGFRRFSLSTVAEAVWQEPQVVHLAETWEALYRLQDTHRSEGVVISNLGKIDSALCAADPRGYGCGAARTMAAVDADGVLFPCHRFVGYFRNGAQQSIGDVFRGFIPERRQAYIQSNRIEAKMDCGAGLYEQDLPAGEGNCQRCLLAPVCGHVCIALNEYLTGFPHQPAAINRLFSQIYLAAAMDQTRSPKETSYSKT